MTHHPPGVRSHQSLSSDCGATRRAGPQSVYPARSARRHRVALPLAVMVIGIAVTACGASGSSAGSDASHPRDESPHATLPPPAVAAFGVGGKALGAPSLVVQMQYDIVQDYGRYVPATVSVKVGDVVEWDQVTPQDQELHNVTFDADTANLISSPATMRYGSVWQVRFTKAGTYTYVCTYHKLRMKGSVTVAA